jgi:hypothetical protein
MSSSAATAPRSTRRTAEIADPDLELWLRRTVRTSANLATGLRRSVRPLVGGLRANGGQPPRGGADCRLGF